MASREKTLLTILVLAIVGAVLCAIAFLLAIGSLATTHHRSVTQSLANWSHEYSDIKDDNDARRAIGMLEYIQNYYVVGPGNRSDPETEQRLESQRAETLQIISEALDEYIEANPDARAASLKSAKANALGENWP
jgi:hypothetical protein